MSLKVICGRAGSGKSTYLLDDMPQSSDTIYIVPEQFSFSAEKRLIQKFGFVGLGNPQVLSFMRLADLVFSKYGAPEFIADSASFEMLVSYCANSITPDNLKLFDGIVKKSELSQTASDIITTFKRYRITPQKLSYAIEKIEDELLKKKLADSLIIYKEYLKEIENACISDQNDTLNVLADILSDEGCDFLDGKHIYIDQFSDFDPSEYECIKIMLRKADRVSIALCTDSSEEFDTVNRTYKRILAIAEDSNVNVEPTEQLSTAMLNSSPMIRHLELSYFDDSSAQFAGNDGSINVFCGKNRFSEIHNVAQKIIHLIRDKKLRYKDISIIARDAELYKGIIERVFPFYDIPVFVDRKMPLSGHSVTMFITSIFDIATSGFTYENIFSYIKSPFSPLSNEEADELENYCLEAGVKPYSWSKPFEYSYGVYQNSNNYEKDESITEKIEHINTLREKVYLPLKPLLLKLKRKATVYELCTALFEFFEKISLEQKIRKHALKLEENGENLYALQTIQVYNILVDIFDDICTVLGQKKLLLHEFHTTVKAGLQSVEIGTIPSSSDCVTIGSIDRIKGHGAKVIFLIGANSGVFPAYPSENGLFSDDDKKVLGEIGIEMPPDLLQLTQSEQLLVYDALTCAGEELYISYSSSNNSSQAMLPSEIVDRILHIFPDISFTDDLTSSPDDERIITSKKAVFDILCSKLRASFNEGKPLSDALSAAAYFFHNDETYSPLLDKAIEMAGFTNESKIVHSALMDKSVGTDMITSITRLEAYNKCPFSYYAKYILKLEPRKTFEVNVSDSGSFLHDFLDQFSQFISSVTDSDGEPMSWKKIDEDFIRANTPVILTNILTGVNAQMLETPRIKALFDRLCRTAEQSVYAVRQHIIKSDFVPMGYEISFDDNGTFKPIRIKLADGKNVTLRGRIDRADEFTVNLPDGTKGKFVRIIDYKSSDKSLSLSDVYHGIQLQLFVYLATLCDNGYSPAGILYCNLSDPMVSVTPEATEDEILNLKSQTRRMDGIVLSEYGMLEHMGGSETLKTKQMATSDNFNSMFRHINKVIKQTAQNIYNGKFPIKCSEEARKWCDYAHLCRFDSKSCDYDSENSQELKAEEVWNLIQKEDTVNEMD